MAFHFELLWFVAGPMCRWPDCGIWFSECKELPNTAGYWSCGTSFSGQFG